MQLLSETLDTWAAIKELEQALPIAALQNVIAERERRHKPRSGLRRRLELLRALQLAEQLKSGAAA